MCWGVSYNIVGIKHIFFQMKSIAWKLRYWKRNLCLQWTLSLSSPFLCFLLSCWLGSWQLLENIQKMWQKCRIVRQVIYLATETYLIGRGRDPVNILKILSYRAVPLYPPLLLTLPWIIFRQANLQATHYLRPAQHSLPLSIWNIKTKSVILRCYLSVSPFQFQHAWFQVTRLRRLWSINTKFRKWFFKNWIRPD